MSVIDETWTADGQTMRGANPHGEVAVFEGEGTLAEDFQRARLAAAAPRMARLLKALEWVSGFGYDYDVCCPCCGMPAPSPNTCGDPHSDDCELAACLRDAGVLT